MVREAFKLINGEGWYIVPTGQGPSPIFTALKSIFHIYFFKKGYICDRSGTLPPCWTMSQLSLFFSFEGLPN